MSIAGTALAIVLSIPIAFLAARNTTTGPVTYQIARTFLNAMRAIPELIMGIIFVAAMVVLKINAGIVLSVLLLTIIGFFIPTEGGTLTAKPDGIIGLPHGIGETFFAMDLMYPFRHFGDTWDIIFAMVFVNMFDTIGTLLGVTRKAGLLDENGKLPKMGGAMTADAASSIAGAAFGTSPVTSYAESAAGISAGGRTGLTGVVVSICFLLALFLTPVLQVIPMMATTPALVIVGVIMMDSIRQIDFDDLAAMSTAVVALMAMPLTFSISEGIALGFIVYVGVKLATGKYKEVTWITYTLAAVFMARYLLDLK
jgi:AGZA family xanthine/uracil permease-like MFS transporter